LSKSADFSRLSGARLVKWPQEGKIVNQPAHNGVAGAWLMPHAPVLVPAVGGTRAAAAAPVIAAMRRAAAAFVAAAPDLAALVSPHAPCPPGRLGLAAGPHLRGTFARFGRPATGIDLPGPGHAPWLVDWVARLAAGGLPVATLPCDDLDHGAVVPLWFLAEAGWCGPTLVLSLPPPENDNLVQTGRSLAAALAAAGLCAGMVASGDMSHALQPGAPCGFHPLAAAWDRTFIERLAARDAAGWLALESDPLRRTAAEDAWDSVRLVMAACGDDFSQVACPAYAAPFGVGYAVARLAGPSAADLPALARASVAAALAPAGQHPAAPDWPPEPDPRPVFVTLRDAAGELRGCVGTLAARHRSTRAETWATARLAAFEDSRFPPLRAAELAATRFEVSVLEAPEPAREPDLDPLIFGVVVHAADGRRGVLLPDLPGVDSAAAQIAIARRKAAIGPGEPVTLERFRVAKFREPDPQPAAP
jgi:MEMO1 family protein